MDDQATLEKDTPILIVDDEASIRLTFEMFLARAGFGPISTASTLDEALIAIKENEFDLIISDIVLEGERGTELLRKIRETGVECPVVMVTGFPNLDTAAEAVRYGAFDYISKPVNKETLLKFVRQALKHWELENEKKQLLLENEKFKRYLEAIFSSVRDAIITIDNEMKIVQLNDTAKQWLQYSEEDKLVSLESYKSEMGKACLQDAQQVLSSRQEVREHQVECKKRDGNIRIISLNAAPLEDGFDEFNGVVIVARDITLPEPVSGSNSRNKFHGYVGCSQVMQNVYNLIENVGKVDTAVLVTGESGTGKELAAEALHAESQRRDMPLVKVDCAAMSEELLESELFGHRKGAFTGADRDRPGRLLQADKGTLFLDEIGDISPRMQLLLLRFLQEKTFTPVGQDNPIAVDVRIIAATNVNFTEKVKDGSFREDLYYRLKVVEIKLPPLRDRKGGIPILVHHFLSMFREKLKRNIHGISDQAMEALARYTWPGNVRELRHIIERACVLCDGPTISLEHFPEEIQKPVIYISAQSGILDHRTNIATLPPYVSEEDEIIEALKHARGNKSKAARILNIDRSTLYRKMQRIGLASDIAKTNNR
ncbi:MAG: sigma-54-dependent Fis family transcriptional regulator [Proteobacteria bacterium]|nr:sigma-54-dependent Fis family transcriptional regulator [Pseudomonadota bacterium]MBU1416988.1 sigma-54-dependent Fis family transcriptional regulator [Pseudomonadota bacterium]MBU1453684.1 sigma-54-dependent Fis family transcriptional regulator [Pseudomonadota bacterium]